MSLLYQLPTIWAFIIFVTLVVMISLIGQYIFKQIGGMELLCGEHNTIIGIFTATVSVFLGIILSFIIVNVWNNYNTAQLNADKEAQAIYLLYGVVRLLPNTEATQKLIIAYLENIINVEYPSMKDGNFLGEGTLILDQLRLAIYGYDPDGDQQTVLYTESIDWLNEVIGLRIDRFNSAFVGVYPVVWWVTIVDSILIIIMAWFINCCGPMHYILTLIISIYVATALFLVIILSYPFEGYSSLSPEPFEIALEQIQIQIK